MRSLLLISALLTSTAFADQLTLTVSGLPEGWQAKVTVAQQTVTFPKNSVITLKKGTYTVNPSAVTDGRKVYVSKPLSVTVAGKAAVNISYTKLAPGSLDPYFGKSGVVDVKMAGLEFHDSWVLKSSGPDAPIITSAGTFDRHRAQLITLNGTPLGPVTQVTRSDRLYGSGQTPSPLLRDGDGFLSGLSYTSGTVVRYDAKGQLDPSWRTTPELVMGVRGLLRLQDGGVLAYGGSQSPALWQMDAKGSTDTTFGKAGVLNLAGLDAAIGQNGVVVTARPMKEGVIRFAVVEDQRLLLVDLTKEGVKAVAPSVQLPFDLTPPYSAGLEPNNITINTDGSAYVMGDDPASGSNRAQVWRVTADGKVDTAFKSTPLSGISRIIGLAVQQDGKVVVAVNDTERRGQVLRYNPNGSLDGTFGQGGRVTLPNSIAALEIDRNGKVKAIGFGLREALNPATAYVRITQLLSE